MKKSTKIVLIVLAILIPIILIVGGLVLTIGIIVLGGINDVITEVGDDIVSNLHTENDLVGTWYDSTKKLNIAISKDNTIEFYTDDKTTIYMKGTYTIQQDYDNEVGDEYIITITAKDRIANGQKYTNEYTTKFSIVTEDYQSAVMMNVSSYNLYYLTKTSEIAKSSGISSDTLNSTSAYSQSDVEKDLRNYITSKYGIKLNDKCEIGKTTKGDDYGYFTPVNDPSYLIQITKSGSTYECSYKEEHLKVRKEIMDEISKYKGKNTVKAYLDLTLYNGVENGPISFDRSADQFLEYVVYYDSSLNMDEQIKQDYKIVKKVNELLNKYSNETLDRVMVLYIDNSKVLDNDWVINSKSNIKYLSLVPNYLTGSYLESSKAAKYYYAVGLDKSYSTELKDMTESQFVQYAKEYMNNH